MQFYRYSNSASISIPWKPFSIYQTVTTNSFSFSSCNLQHVYSSPTFSALNYFIWKLCTHSYHHHFNRYKVGAKNVKISDVDRCDSAAKEIRDDWSNQSSIAPWSVICRIKEKHQIIGRIPLSIMYAWLEIMRVLKRIRNSLVEVMLLL